MPRAKVADADLRAFLDAGHSQADAARHFGVSEPAIHQRLKRKARFDCWISTQPFPIVETFWRRRTGAAGNC
jgi:hypothetical protein